MPTRSIGLWAVIGVLLVVAAVPPLLVATYDRTSPTLWGFPFYYWFQFLLVIWAALCTTAAYQLAKVATRRDRAARGQSPDGPEGGAR